jgi:hypothetical protein
VLKRLAKVVVLKLLVSLLGLIIGIVSVGGLSIQTVFGGMELSVDLVGVRCKRKLGRNIPAPSGLRKD